MPGLLGNTRYDYGSTYGSKVLPGGRLKVSPSNTGQPRSLYGVDFPVVGYPDTGYDSGPSARLEYPYQNTIPGVGLPYRGEIGGGPGSSYTQGHSSQLDPFDPMGYQSNPPPNQDVSPDLINTFYGSDVPNDTRGSSRYPNLSGAPPVTPQGYYDNPGYINPQYIGAEIPGNVNIPGQNYAGYQPPVARATAVQPPGGFFGRMWRRLSGQPMGNFTYPVPGLGGFPSTYGGGQSWQSNASRAPSGLNLWNSGGFHGLIGGLGSLFSGGTPVSNIPEYSGFAGPVGRSSAGPLQP